MRRFTLLVCITFVSMGFLYACGDDETLAPAPTADASTVDVTSPAIDSGSTNPGTDAGTDTGAPDSGDAATDAGADAAPNALFAHLNQTLVSVNPTTGAVTTVGATAQPWLVLAWDDTAKVARAIIDGYSPAGGAATPKLATINLCTGTVTAGPAITIAGTQVRRSEGLAQDPANGTWHVTVGTNGTGAATQYISEQNGTIDVTTGAVTIRGPHSTLQNDGDGLLFVGGGQLRLHDVATDLNGGALYSVNLTTGATTAPVTTGPSVLRVAYDKTRSVAFTLAGTGADGAATARSAGTLNLTTGANTSLGTTLAAGTYGNGQWNALMSAPAPVCP